MTKAQEDQAMAIAEAVAKAIAVHGGRNGVPKTVLELVWRAAMTFGIPVVVLGVILLICYQTVPNWVQANIETQRSLTEHLDRVSESLDRSTERLNTITEYEKKTVEFHEEVYKEHGQHSDEHKVIVGVLETISENLRSKDQPSGW